MPKLNQIVAVVSGKKTRVEKEFGDLNKLIQKPELFHGLSKTYRPIDENGEGLPSESKLPQKNAAEIIANAKQILTGIIDAVATQEYGNTEAKADIKVNGTAILSGVPVTVLLYLEKQLNDMHTFVDNMPTLDPAERWEKNDQDGQYVTEPTSTVRTKKVQKALVLFPATDKHPAQTQLITEDITAGHWTTTKFATVMAAKEKREILARIVQLQDAVKIAREDANDVAVTEKQIASPLLKYIFGN
jgi:hypothetical protein